MKASTLILTITGSIILAAGIGIAVIGLAKGGTLQASGEKFEKMEYEFSDMIKNINISETSHDMRFIKSTDGKTHVSCYDSEKSKHTVEVKGDTLEIKFYPVGTDAKWYDYVHFNVYNADQLQLQTEVSLPEELYDRLTIDGSSSDLFAENTLSFKDAEVSASSGDIDFNSKISDELKIKTSSGNIKAIDCDSVKASFEASSGNINIRDYDASSVKIGTSSGNITLGNINAETFSAQATSGDIELDSGKVKDNAEFETSSGYIKASDLEAGILIAKATSGDIEMNSLTSDDVRVSTSSGEQTYNKASFGKINLESTSGNITFSGVEIKKDSNIETSSGEVEGTVIGEYLFQTKTSSGDENVPASSREGALLDIKTTSGDINLSAS